MSKTIKVALAGAGAFGIKHLDGIQNIDGVEVGVQNAGGLDGRWALNPGGIATLFSDNDGDVSPGFVNSIQIYDTALPKAQIFHTDEDMRLWSVSRRPFMELPSVHDRDLLQGAPGAMVE